jgi:hypothetical protein
MTAPAGPHFQRTHLVNRFLQVEVWETGTVMEMEME